MHCTGALARLKHQLKRTYVETNVPRKLTVTARTIFSPLHKAQMVLEGESQGRHLDTGDGFTRKHDRLARTANSRCILGPTKTSAKDLARDHVRSASALSALKKVWSPTCALNGSFSVAKLSAKRIFSVAKRDFLVANGRMAADFSSPGFGILFLSSFSDTCFSSVCCCWLIFSPACRLQCWRSSNSLLCKERHHGWGRYPRFARLLLQVSFVAHCELTGSSVSCWQ